MAEKLELHRIKDFINLTFCCQEATVITDFSDLNAVGRDHYMNLHGGCAPVTEWESLNGEEIARSLIESGSGTITPYGVVYDNGMKLEQCYRGKQFPAYSYEPEMMALTLHEKHTDFNAETATWLFLPMEDEQLSRTLLRSGITAPDELQFQFQSSRFPDEIDAALQFETEDIHDLNALCEACAKFNEVDFAKLASVCEMATPSSAADMRQLAENIEQFDFIPNVYSPEEYGKYMIQKSGCFEYDENLDDFYNYGDYGAARIREENGMFAYRGYVSYHGTLGLDELYIWPSNPVAVEYIRNCLKRVRKKESALLMASQNLEDFNQPSVREMTKPLFAIPPHQFLFNPGSIDKRSYMDMLQLEDSEFDLIKFAPKGLCLYKCGNERYLLEVHAPPYKEALFGKAGGR